MNYTECNPPCSGEKPQVYLNLDLNNKFLGQLKIELFRDAFPLGVENFVYMCKGTTYRVEDKGFPPYTYKKVTKRTFENSKIYDYEFDNYIKMGDIYKNDGTGIATIFNDALIPEPTTNYYYEFSEKGLIALVPTLNQETGTYYYDSNFIITLDIPRPTNSIGNLQNYIVIGKVIFGLDIVEQINKLISPFSGRSYPNIIISKSNSINTNPNIRRKRPVINDVIKYACKTKNMV